MLECGSIDLQDSLKLGKWFLWSGIIGVIVAVTIAVTPLLNAIPDECLLALWPTAMAQLADPHSIPGFLILIVVVYGGNFVYFGVIGLAIGFATHKFGLLFRR
jgi:hypothetical protein